MSFEVRSYEERTAALARIETLMHRIRSGGGQHIEAHDECDARLTAIFAFDFRQARTGDREAQARVASYRADNHRSRVRGMKAIIPEPAEPIEASAPRDADPRDAVLTAMRTMNRPIRPF